MKYTRETLEKLSVEQLADICVEKFSYLVSVTYESCKKETLINAILNDDTYIFYKDLPDGCLA